jgi:hypothetical protein
MKIMNHNLAGFKSLADQSNPINHSHINDPRLLQRKGSVQNGMDVTHTHTHTTALCWGLRTLVLVTHKCCPWERRVTYS